MQKGDPLVFRIPEKIRTKGLRGGRRFDGRRRLECCEAIPRGGPRALHRKPHSCCGTKSPAESEGARHRSDGSRGLPFCCLILSVDIQSVFRRQPPMPNSLPELEAERSQILGQFTTLGDLRPVRSARFLAAAENRLAIAPNPMTQGTIRKFDGHVKSQE